MNKNILILSAHNDDSCLGCAGTIYKFTREQNTSAHLLVFTDGASARFYGRADYDELVKQNDRRFLTEKECKILGISRHKYFDFPDNRMDSVPLLDVVKSIENYLEEQNIIPDIVLTHQPYCLNVDHQQIFKATITVFRGLEKFKKTKIMCYEVASSSEWNNFGDFKPNCYVEINENYLSVVKDALNVYKDELRPSPHPRNFETKQAKMLLSGTECGCSYAERFMIFREVL